MNEKQIEFQVNDLLALKLEDNKANIYISGNLFRQCKYLLIDIPIENVSSLDELESIDEAAEKLNHTLEPRREAKQFTYNIPPETEFWGHCSNLQVWHESGYNTKLLHSNLAFPLLKQLKRAGDQQAKKVFKEEIAKRYNYGVKGVREYLRSKKYIMEMTDEEFLSLIEDEKEYEAIEHLLRSYPQLERSERGALTLKQNLDIKKGKVEKLDLSALELTRLPEEIRSLSSLEHLNLSYNLLEELPEWIGEFKALKVLRITDNQLKTLSDSISGLILLEELYARGNQLKTLPETIEKLSLLKVFEAYQNNLTAIPESIKNLINLEKFNVHDNKLTSITTSIFNLSNLESLDLHNNQINSLPELTGALEKLKLKALYLGNNKLKLLPDTIGNLKNLEVLSLDDNPIYKLPQSLYNLPRLKKLYIDNTHLKKYQVKKENFSNNLIKTYFLKIKDNEKKIEDY